MKAISILTSFLLVLFAGSVFAQEHQHHHPSENFGRVEFQTSCSVQAQKQFNRAAAILHSFGYEEAALAFEEVAKTDPDCAMAYWGVAMTYYHPIWVPPNAEELRKGKEAIEKAKITGKPTEREKAYIDALDVFYRDSDTLDHLTRARSYSKAMEVLSKNYPDDEEALIFYALALRGTAVPTDKTYAVQKQSAAILNKILDKHPQHPGIAHYLIHSYDYPGLAELALPAARVYAKIAPSSPHAIHMPSHIFTRLGYWQESVDSNIASAASAVEHTQKLHPGSGSFDQLHAMDYLVYAYLQLGQDAKAKHVFDEMNTITKLDQAEFASGYAFAAIPVRYAIERGKWSDAAKITRGPEWYPWKNFPFAEAITYFGRALGAARSDDPERARTDLARLDALHEAMAGMKNPTYDWAGQIEIQRQAAAAWIAFAEKKSEEALQMMRAVADRDDSTDKHAVTPGSVIPARELYGDMLMELNKPAEALVQYETSLANTPNRFYAISGAAKAAKLSGNEKKAKMYYARLVQLCSPPCERPEVSEAKAFLAKK